MTACGLPAPICSCCCGLAALSVVWLTRGHTSRDRHLHVQHGSAGHSPRPMELPPAAGTCCGQVTVSFGPSSRGTLAVIPLTTKCLNTACLNVPCQHRQCQSGDGGQGRHSGDRYQHAQQSLSHPITQQELSHAAGCKRAPAVLGPAAQSALMAACTSESACTAPAAVSGQHRWGQRGDGGQGGRHPGDRHLHA